MREERWPPQREGRRQVAENKPSVRTESINTHHCAEPEMGLTTERDTDMSCLPCGWLTRGRTPNMASAVGKAGAERHTRVRRPGTDPTRSQAQKHRPVPQTPVGGPSSWMRN